MGWEEDFDSTRAQILTQDIPVSVESTEKEVIDKDKGLTLADSRNGFNELSCLTTLWNNQHIWTTGARFVLNCYHDEALLFYVCQHMSTFS